MDNGPDQDQFDDLFEPFELEEGPAADAPPEDVPPPSQQPPSPVSTPLNCPSCGAANPPQNRHCEQCGARLGKSPLPVAPPPAVRTTPGGRALSVLAVVVGIVAIITIAFNLTRGEPNAQVTTTTIATTTTTDFEFTELRPTSVEASSHLTGYEPDKLLDCTDDEKYWNDQSARGVNAVLTFRFAQPVQIRDIELQNLVDNTKFKLNFRIKDFVITVDDLGTETVGTLRDVNEPQSVAIASLNTTLVTLEVRSTYPAEAVNDNAPFSELALQCVRFFGATAG
ncbi:MAG TPA: zinc ribbon domain-containing protein [Acidimicrobiia bacterium]